MKSELTKTAQLPLTSDEQPTFGALAMIDRMIEKGITADNVAALKELRGMHIDQEERNAKKAFSKAFREMQAELPPIAPTKIVPDKQGNTKFKYAPYDELMRIVGPIMQKHGFAPSFSTKFHEGRVISVCTLIHDDGHERTNEYSVRIGSGPPGATESQADGAANQYAQRGALCDALNIVIQGRDNDARDLGAPVTADQAEDLRQRVADTKSNEAVFLKFAGATKYEDIPAVRYKDLDAMLRTKEGRR